MTGVIEMCKWTIPKQYARIDPTAPPEHAFKRFENPIISDAHLKAVRGMLPHTGEYISVYGWTGWNGGTITREISKTAHVDGVFFDFDDKDDPQKAIRDAAEVAAYVGHCTGNFSGAKGAHLWLTCHPVDLIPDLKGHVIRQFVNNLVDVLPELDTLDFAVVGDTSRVRRIIDSVHPKMKLHAIGLTAEELATRSIEEIMSRARDRRGLIQVPEPSQWVTDELYRIQEKILEKRLDRLWFGKQISDLSYLTALRRLTRTAFRDQTVLYDEIKVLEDEWRRIRTNQQLDQRGSVIRGERIGATAEETWLLKAWAEFRATGRAATGSRKSEHKARVHLAKLANECGWTFSEICDIFTEADDYDPGITERMVQSCIGRR